MPWTRFAVHLKGQLKNLPIHTWIFFHDTPVDDTIVGIMEFLKIKIINFYTLLHPQRWASPESGPPQGPSFWWYLWPHNLTFQIAQVVTFCDVYQWWRVVTWLCSVAWQEKLESSLERPLDPFEKV
jgi:hypothetical protein